MSKTKRRAKNLTLNKKTLRRLCDDDLADVAGGVARLPTTQNECEKTAFGVCPH